MKEIKPVTTERQHIDERFEFFINLLEFLDYQDFDSRVIIKGYQIKITSVGLKHSIELLIDELKPVVTEKHHFDKRVESFL